MKRLHYLTLLSICCTLGSFAQPFKPDEIGYVKDSAFHQLLRNRKYEMVTAFDSVKGYPGVYAFALREKATYMLDVNGTETLIKEDPEKVERRNSFDNQNPKKQEEKWLEIIVKDNGTKVIKHSDGREYKIPDCEKVVELKHAKQYPKSAFSYCVGTNWGLLSDKGEVTLPPTYFAIREEDSVPERFVVLSEAKLLGIIDRDARIVLEPCLKGMLSLIASKYGYMNTSSHGLVDLRTGLSVYAYPISERKFKGTIYYVSHESLSGLFDLKTLKEILPPAYTSFHDVIDGHFVVEKQLNGVSKYGLSDLSGKTSIPVLYDQLYLFPKSANLLMKKGNFYGIVTKENKVLIQPEYQFLDPIIGLHDIPTNYLVFTKNDITGVMNTKQEIIIKPERCNIKATETGLCVRKATGCGVYSFRGEERIKPIYSKINDSSKPGIFTAHKKNDPAIYKVDFYGNELKVEIPSPESLIEH